MSILKSNIKDMVNLMDKLTNRIGKLTNLPLLGSRDVTD
jgi:hypothetical protein